MTANDWARKNLRARVTRCAISKVRSTLTSGPDRGREDTHGQHRANHVPDDSDHEVGIY
jgi:hypothetical protein